MGAVCRTEATNKLSLSGDGSRGGTLLRRPLILKYYYIAHTLQAGSLCSDPDALAYRGVWSSRWRSRSHARRRFRAARVRCYWRRLAAGGHVEGPIRGARSLHRRRAGALVRREACQSAARRSPGDSASRPADETHLALAAVGALLGLFALWRRRAPVARSEDEPVAELGEPLRRACRSSLRSSRGSCSSTGSAAAAVRSRW